MLGIDGLASAEFAGEFSSCFDSFDFWLPAHATILPGRSEPCFASFVTTGEGSGVGKDERSAVLDALESGFERTLEGLCELSRIPGVSAAGFDRREVERSAAQVADLLSDAGLENAEVLSVGDSHPYAIADWLHAGAGAPTVLIYAHHDVQPPGRPERWLTPAFEPTLRDDGRLYGRGVVDDKAGLMLHLAALRAWFEAADGPPVNVKLMVEGEEEIGSPHLAEFLLGQRERLDADVLILSDTANLETGLPSLTTSLRGLVIVDVTVRALDHPVHSGMWGGPTTDTASAMVRLLARLIDDAGVIQIPGIYDDVPETSPDLRAQLEALPFDELAFRAEAGLLTLGPLAGESDRNIWERLWFRPSLAFTAIEGVPLAAAASQLMDVARARVGLRLAPGQDPERATRLLCEFLHRDPPAGARVELSREAVGGGWRTEPNGPAFDAARRALEAGYGRPAISIGCGGSISFVGPFAEVLGGAPALLLGLEDPVCNAHGENESLCVDDFYKAARSSVHLLDELRGFK
ncbi:MAG: M20/M25/M40 family metallo-hydrolase [bacterium]|nr:M20/M25/M40 family metallo-hydrolase [bacterium]